MENIQKPRKQIPFEIKIQAFELLALMITIVGLFLWCRSDAKDDYRAMQQRTESLIEAIKKDMEDFHDAMSYESKDFHGRLCTVEEKGRRSP